MRNIRQNLFFALIYNAVGVPVPAGSSTRFSACVLASVLAAAARTLSSLSASATPTGSGATTWHRSL